MFEYIFIIVIIVISLNYFSINFNVIEKLNFNKIRSINNSIYYTTEILKISNEWEKIWDSKKNGLNTFSLDIKDIPYITYIVHTRDNGILFFTFDTSNTFIYYNNFDLIFYMINEKNIEMPIFGTFESILYITNSRRYDGYKHCNECEMIKNRTIYFSKRKLFAPDFFLKTHQFSNENVTGLYGNSDLSDENNYTSKNEIEMNMNCHMENIQPLSEMNCDMNGRSNTKFDFNLCHERKAFIWNKHTKKMIQRIEVYKPLIIKKIPRETFFYFYERISERYYRRIIEYYYKTKLKPFAEKMKKEGLNVLNLSLDEQIELIEKDNIKILQVKNFDLEVEF